MNKEHSLAIVIFAACFMALSCAYLTHLKNSFMQNDTRYVQAGVMKYQSDGKELYIPVFTVRN